jgi:hypothetical protein
MSFAARARRRFAIEERAAAQQRRTGPEIGARPNALPIAPNAGGSTMCVP